MRHPVSLSVVVLLKVGLFNLVLAFLWLIYFYYVTSKGHPVPFLFPILLFWYIVNISFPFCLERRLDLFSPVVFFMLIKAQWIGKPLIQIAKGEYSNSQLPELSQSQAFDLLIAALAILVIGHSSYLVGYYGSGFRLLPTPTVRMSVKWNHWKLKLTTGLIFVLCGFSYFVVMREAGGWLGMWHQLGDHSKLYADVKIFLHILDVFPSLLLMLLVLPHIQKGRLPNWLIPAVIVVVVLLAATGDRSKAFYPLLALMVFAHYLYRRFPLWKFAPIVLLIMWTALGIQDLRRSTWSGEGIDLSVLQGHGNAFTRTAEEFFIRRRSIDLFGVMLTLMPEDLPYQYGRPYLNLLVVPIPRKYWPGKPLNIDESGMVGRALYGREKGYGLAVGTEGALFMNFHILGVIAGFCILGIFHRKVYSIVQSYNKHPGIITLYSMVFYRFLSMSPMSIFDTAMTFFPTWMVLRFISRKSRGGYAST